SVSRTYRADSARVIGFPGVGPPRDMGGGSPPCRGVSGGSSPRGYGGARSPPAGGYGGRQPPMPGGLRGVVPPGQQSAFSHTVSGCVLSRSRPMRYTRTTTVRGSTMLPTDRVQSAGREKLNLVERVERATDRIPLPQRIVPIIGAVVFLCPVLAPIAVVGKVRTKMATAYVAMLA